MPAGPASASRSRSAWSRPTAARSRPRRPRRAERSFVSRSRADPVGTGTPSRAGIVVSTGGSEVVDLMRRHVAVGASVVVAAALIPVVLRIGHERSAGCEHPAHYPCDGYLVRPGWVAPVVAALALWIAAAGLGLILSGVRRWGQTHPERSRTVARSLRWSAVAAGA